MALNDNFSFELLLEQGHVLLQQLAKHQTDMKVPMTFNVGRDPLNAKTPLDSASFGLYVS
jgi:hypothetical protein